MSKRLRTILTTDQNCLQKPLPGQIAVTVNAMSKQLSGAAGNAYTAGFVVQELAAYKLDSESFKVYPADANNGMCVRVMQDCTVTAMLSADRDDATLAGQAWMHYTSVDDLDWDSMDAGEDQAEWQTDSHAFQAFVGQSAAAEGKVLMTSVFSFAKDWAFYFGTDADSNCFSNNGLLSWNRMTPE